MPMIPERRKRPWRKAASIKPQSGRKADNRFYNSTAWRKLSKAFREEHPLCEECLKKGKYVPSEVADHIVRVEDGGEPLDRNNLQALCHRCHNRKSGKERHGYKAKKDDSSK